MELSLEQIGEYIKGWSEMAGGGKREESDDPMMFNMKLEEMGVKKITVTK